MHDAIVIEGLKLPPDIGPKVIRAKKSPISGVILFLQIVIQKEKKILPINSEAYLWIYENPKLLGIKYLN